MYWFKLNTKEAILKGRSIRYVAKNIVHCSEVHLSNILNSKIGCSYSLAKNISDSIGKNIDECFTLVER